SALATIHDRLRAAWPDAVVLSPRAAPSVDGDFLDDLGAKLGAAWASLADAEQEAIVPSRLDALITPLPPLELVPAIANRAPSPLGGGGHAAVTAAIDALRESLTMLSRRRPVALLIDDLDEIDADGARVVADVLRGPDP